MQKPGTFPSENSCRAMLSSVAHDQVIDLDAVGKSKLPISITDLEFHSSMVAVGKKF